MQPFEQNTPAAALEKFPPTTLLAMMDPKTSTDRHTSRYATPGLIGGKGKKVTHTEQLAEAFMESPINIDGILIQKIPTSDGGTELVFNPSLIGGDISLRTADDILVRRENPQKKWKLDNQQLQRIEDAKQPTQKRVTVAAAKLGGLATGCYTAAELTHPVLGPIVAGASLLAGAWGHSRRSAKKDKEDAVSALATFNDWCMAEENGAIRMPYADSNSWNHSISIKKHGAVEKQSESLIAYQRTISTLPVDHIVNKIREYFNGCCSDWGGTYDLGQSIEHAYGKHALSLLALSKSPSELWQSGFSESLRDSADSARELVRIKQEKKRLQRIAEFTGEPGNAEESADLDAAEKVLQHAIFNHSVRMQELFQQQVASHQNDRRLHEMTELLATVAGGIERSAHPLEMHLQTLQSIAVERLALLDTSNDASISLIKDISAYLEGTRTNFQHRKDMEQFYKGMVRKFGDKIPGGLPDWDAVSERFPKTAA